MNPIANGNSSLAQAPPMDAGELLMQRVGTRLCGVSWLNERVAVLVVETTPYHDHVAELRVTGADGDTPLLADTQTFPVGEGEEREGRVILAFLPDGAPSGAAGLRIQVRSWRRTMSIDPDHLEEATVDVRSLLRGQLAWLDPDKRSEMLQLMASASEWQSHTGGGVALSRSLRTARDGLREPLPTSVRDRAEPQGLSVDLLMSIDSRSFWVKGWAQNAEGRPSSLRALAPEGLSAELLHGAFWHDRADVRQLYGLPDPQLDSHPGFVHYFELDGPSRLPKGWICEMHCGGGGSIETEMPDAVADPRQVRNRILTELGRPHEGAGGLARSHAHPALQRLQRNLLSSVDVASVQAFGKQPDEPAVSIIVPLYRRLDLIEYQLAEWVHDRGLDHAEVVFVLDSPELQDRLREKARDLHRLFRVPYRVAVLSRGVGFAAACNRGARLARGRLLTFLHSDVLAGQPGWLARMRTFYDQMPNIGALGPKLLFEDGTVDSAGMHFRKPPGDDLWEAAPLLRGLHGRFPAASENRTVPALSSACLMIDAALFHDAGGFREDFVQGGYEDADLCLRLAELGRENWCAGAVELFHLKAQSYPFKLQELTGTYNRWLHDQLWSDVLESRTDDFGVSGSVPRAGAGRSGEGM